MMDEKYLLRHFIATLKYRFSKAVSNAPAHYSTFELGNGVRTPKELVVHMSDVIRYAQSALGHQIQKPTEVLSWEGEIAIFVNELKLLDQFILTTDFSGKDNLVEKLIQGPLSDAMTHTGQLAMLRRMVHDPIPRENFFAAHIEV